MPLSNEYFIFSLSFAAKFCSLFLHLYIVSHILLFEDKDVPSHTKTSNISASTTSHGLEATRLSLTKSTIPGLLLQLTLWPTHSHSNSFLSFSFFFLALMIPCSSNLDFLMLSRWFFSSPHFISQESFTEPSLCFSTYLLPRSLHLCLEFHFL